MDINGTLKDTVTCRHDSLLLFINGFCVETSHSDYAVL